MVTGQIQYEDKNGSPAILKYLENIQELDAEVKDFLIFCLKEAKTLQSIKDHQFLKDDSFWRSLE